MEQRKDATRAIRKRAEKKPRRRLTLLHSPSPDTDTRPPRTGDQRRATTPGGGKIKCLLSTDVAKEILARSRLMEDLDRRSGLWPKDNEKRTDNDALFGQKFAHSDMH